MKRFCLECHRVLHDPHVTRDKLHFVPMRNPGPDSIHFCGPTVVVVDQEQIDKEERSDD